MAKSTHEQQETSRDSARTAEAVTAIVLLAWWLTRKWPKKILSQKEFVILTTLEEYPWTRLDEYPWSSIPPIQADLADHLEDQPSGISRIVNGLVRRGLVDKTRRHGHLRVTKTGTAQLDRCRKRVVRQAGRRLRRLPRDDQQLLVNAVRVLAEWRASGLV